MRVGSEGSAEITAGETDSAQAMGSGSLPVFATPRMIALMEQAACAAVADQLQNGQTTVGIYLEVEHSAPSPLGAHVRARAVLERVEGRVLHFAVSAEAGGQAIGQGTHRRAVVDADKFMEKVNTPG